MPARFDAHDAIIVVSPNPQVPSAKDGVAFARISVTCGGSALAIAPSAVKIEREAAPVMAGEGAELAISSGASVATDDTLAVSGSQA